MARRRLAGARISLGLRFGAAEQHAGYFPLERNTGGITPVNLSTGTELWHTAAISGAVFSDAREGMLRAYSTKDGAILWDFNAKQFFERVPAKGGGLGGPGVTVSEGMVFSNPGTP
jgi:outer membrane protein assembly factor BamB